MTSIATLPQYAVPEKPTTLTVTITGANANYARVWCTNAPVGSKLRTAIDKSTQNRVHFFDTDGGASHPYTALFEKGGAYTFVVQEYQRGASTIGGGYEGASASAPSETKVGSEAPITLYIGQRMTSAIGVGKDLGKLVLWVWNGTIRETTESVHGEKSPAIIEPSSPSAIAATESTTVKTALSDLKGVSVATAIGTVSAIVSEMVSDINAHFAMGATTHNAADSDNDIPVGLITGTTPADLQSFVNAELIALRRHYTNDNAGAGTGTGGVDSAAYHQITGTKKNDYLNAPLFRSVGSLDEAYRALADIWRSYEAHRASTAVHGTADSTNTLATLPKLLLLHKAFLTIIASASPTTPPTQSSGAMSLMQQCGFIEA